MEKNNKSVIFLCINNLDRGGAEKQISYLANYLSNFFDVNLILLNSKIRYSINKKIKISILNKNIFLNIFLFFFLLLKKKPKIVCMALPKTYILFSLALIFFPKIQKVLLRRSLNYYNKFFLYRFLEILLHKFTNYFVTNSFAAKKNLVNEEGVNKKKVIVIPNYFEIIKNKKRKSIKFKSKIIRILCIANFYNYKGHRILLESLAKLKNLNWKIYLHGQDRDLKKKDIINIALSYNIANRVVFIKKLNFNHVFPYFKLGILLSKTESFPNAILEYFYLRLPILAYNTGDIKFLVDSSNGKLVTKRNSFILSNQIKKILNDKDLNSKSKKSFFNLKKYSNLKKTLGQYKILIEKLLCAV